VLYNQRAVFKKVQEPVQKWCRPTAGDAFNITGTADIPIVVKACTNLANASWVALQSLNLLVLKAQPPQTFQCQKKQGGDAQNQQRCPKVGCTCNRDADAAE